MNSDDSIRIALDVICEPIWFDLKNQTCRETLVRFIKEIYEAGRADEREACAQVCEEQIKSYMSKQYTTDPLGGFRERFAAGQCADAIRARGEK